MAESPLDSFFGEAARLYAENEAVVVATREFYQQDIDRFLNDIRDAAESCVEEPEVHEQITGGGKHRSWWLGGKDRVKQPYLWFNSREKTIVKPGSLRFIGYFETSDPQARDLLAQGLAAVELPSSCTSQKPKGKWMICDFTVSYGEVESPVDMCAEALGELLTTMHRIWKESVAGSEEE